MLRNRSRRRLTGGKRKSKRKFRKHELKRESILCKVGNKERKKRINVRGNQEKVRARTVGKLNVADSEGDTNMVKIEDVLENEANSHFVRRSALTKGTVVKTENGKAKITSRPGQEGIVNAVRIE
ncbi:MAG: 30S ribosomal protein S8e [Candidatus Aenigmatarchaeota archaeon]